MIRTTQSFKALFILLIFAFASCSSNDNGGNQDPTNDNNDNNNNNGGTEVVATIETEADGQIDYAYDFILDSMRPKIRHESHDGKDLFFFSSKNGDFSIGMRVFIDGEGEYTLEAESPYEDLSLIRDEDEGHNNDTVFKIDDNFEDDQATLTITSLTEDHIKATFSATLYNSSTGEKATLTNGKIDTDIIRVDFD
ncbi:hypothetical protein [Mesonia sp.]|uniref:hypothetical protein n=1 Tax=Mesonia sp. TaxID=1960830 RepID=UPI003F965A49